MRLRVALLAGINAALIGSTAVSAADLIIDTPIVEEAASTFTLSVNAGVIAFGLPDFATPGETSDGPLDLGLDNVALGGIIEFNAHGQISEGDGTAFGIGLKGFGAFATRSGGSTVELENDSFFFLPGITTPVGTVSLATDPAAVGGPTAGALVVGTTEGVDQLALAPANALGQQQIWGTVQDPPNNSFSFIGAGTSTDGAADDSAFAFGAIASGEGGVFLAVGDLEGWEVTSDITHDMIYAGADLTFSVSNTPADGEALFMGYIGPSYKYLSQSIATEITVDVPEITVPEALNPLYIQSTTEDLVSHYLGGVIGGSVTAPMGDTSSITFGLEGGIYHVSTSYDASESYSITGPSDPALSLGDQTVENAVGATAEDTEIAYAASASATWSTDVSETMQFNLGVGAEYLSKVATPGRDTSGMTGLAFPSADDAVYTGPEDAGNFIAYGDMWSAKLTAGITGQF